MTKTAPGSSGPNAAPTQHMLTVRKGFDLCCNQIKSVTACPSETETATTEPSPWSTSMIFCPSNSSTGKWWGLGKWTKTDSGSSSSTKSEAACKHPGNAWASNTWTWMAYWSSWTCRQLDTRSALLCDAAISWLGRVLGLVRSSPVISAHKICGSARGANRGRHGRARGPSMAAFVWGYGTACSKYGLAGLVCGIEPMSIALMASKTCFWSASALMSDKGC